MMQTNEMLIWLQLKLVYKLSSVTWLIFGFLEVRLYKYSSDIVIPLTSEQIKNFNLSKENCI